MTATSIDPDGYQGEPERTIAPVYSITPATATTCGDGSGTFCRFCKWSLDGTATCYLFGEIEERDG